MPRRQRGLGPEEESVRIHSMPEELRQQVRDLAARRSTPTAPVHERDVYIAALKDLVAACDAGERAIWLAPERVTGQLQVWLPVDVSERFRALAHAHRQSLTTVFLTATRLYLKRNRTLLEATGVHR